MSVMGYYGSHSRSLRRNIRIVNGKTQDCDIKDILLRIFLRIIVIGILSVVLVFPLQWSTHQETLGFAAAQIIFSSRPPSFLGNLGEALEILFGVDFLVWFGFLFGVWFLWTQGRNGRRRQGNSKPWVHRLRLTSIVVVAMVCALPLSYYVLLVQSKFHSGLAETPGEVMESFILSILICATAFCGIAILGRFWPSSES
jgi:hypothetical protein